MDDLPVAGLAQHVSVVEHALQFALADLAAGDADLGLDDPRAGKAARQVGDDLLDRLAGHLLGGVHRAGNRGAGGFEIDDRAVAQPAGDLMADADDLRPLGLDPRDKAAHFARADVECGNEAAARPMRRLYRPPRLALPDLALPGFAALAVWLAVLGGFWRLRTSSIAVMYFSPAGVLS